MLFRIFPHSPIPIWKSFALPSQVWGGNGRLFAEAHGGTYLHEPTQPDSLQDPKGLHRILTKLLLDQMADGAWQNVKIDKHIPYSSYFKGVEASSSQWNPNCWRPSFGWGHGSKCILSLWRWWDHLPGPLAESWTNGNGADFWIRFPKLDPSGRLSAANCTWHRREYFLRRHGITLQRKQPMLYCPFRAKQEAADWWSRGLCLFWCFVLWLNWLGSCALFVVNFTLWSGLFVAGLVSIFFGWCFIRTPGWFFQ